MRACVCIPSDISVPHLPIHIGFELCKHNTQVNRSPSHAGVQAETTVKVSAAVLQRLSGLESVNGVHDQHALLSPPAECRACLCP